MIYILTEEQKQEIIKQYISGEKFVYQIAEDFGINKKNVYSILKKNNVPSNSKILSDSDKIKITECYCNGETAKNLSKKYNVDVKTINNILRQLNINFRQGCKKYNYDDKFFETYTPESCYWSGFIAADGNIRNDAKDGRVLSISIQKRDVKHLTKFLNCLKANNKISKDENQVYVNVCSKKIVNDLEKMFELTPRKSFTLKWPKSLPNDMVSHYLRGVFDGDGTICRSGNGQVNLMFSIISASYHFLEDMKDKIYELTGINCGIYKKNNNKNTINKGGAKDVVQLFNWIYKESKENIKLDRKFKIFEDFLFVREIYEYSKVYNRIFTERNVQILNLKDKGMGVGEIAKQFKTTDKNIYFILSNFKKYSKFLFGV